MAGTLAAELNETIADLDLDGVIDVGGHHGEFTDFLRRSVGYTGPVVSFEPAPEAFANLARASNKDSQWEVHNVAIGSEPGNTELHIYDSTFLNSFHRLSTTSRTQYDAIDPVSSVTVQVNRLDELYKPSWGRRLLLKSDTQGSDLAVIDSADGIMDKVLAVQVEAGVVPIYSDIPSLTDTVEYFESLGFGASSFYPVTRHEMSRAVVEFDITFVRLNM